LATIAYPNLRTVGRCVWGGYLEREGAGDSTLWERLKGLAGSESHLVASFLESHTKGDKGLDDSPLLLTAAC